MHVQVFCVDVFYKNLAFCCHHHQFFHSHSYYSSSLLRSDTAGGLREHKPALCHTSPWLIWLVPKQPLASLALAPGKANYTFSKHHSEWFIFLSTLLTSTQACRKQVGQEKKPWMWHLCGGGNHFVDLKWSFFFFFFEGENNTFLMSCYNCFNCTHNDKNLLR